MIFEKGNKPTHYTFYLYGNKIEVVSSFKHLGVLIFKNANWYRTQKCISEQANLQLHRLFCVFQEIELPFSQKCKTFDMFNDICLCMYICSLTFLNHLCLTLK